MLQTLAREMVPQGRALATLAKDTGSVLNTHMAVTAICKPTPRVFGAPLQGSEGTECIWYTDKTPIHIF